MKLWACPDAVYDLPTMDRRDARKAGKLTRSTGSTYHTSNHPFDSLGVNPALHEGESTRPDRIYPKMEPSRTLGMWRTSVRVRIRQAIFFLKKSVRRSAIADIDIDACQQIFVLLCRWTHQNSARE